MTGKKAFWFLSGAFWIIALIALLLFIPKGDLGKTFAMGDAGKKEMLKVERKVEGVTETQEEKRREDVFVANFPEQGNYDDAILVFCEEPTFRHIYKEFAEFLDAESGAMLQFDPHLFMNMPSGQSLMPQGDSDFEKEHILWFLAKYRPHLVVLVAHEHCVLPERVTIKYSIREIGEEQRKALVSVRSLIYDRFPEIKVEAYFGYKEKGKLVFRELASDPVIVIEKQ